MKYISNTYYVLQNIADIYIDNDKYNISANSYVRFNNMCFCKDRRW
jgi:hypothetical protein